MHAASLPRAGSPALAPTLLPFVELRAKLLRAELETAVLVGRTADVGTLKAELRGLQTEPGTALMIRVAPGRLVSGGTRSAADFANQASATQRRLTELEDEVRQWRAGKGR